MLNKLTDTERIAALEGRVSWLESELRISQEINITAKIRQKWNLTPSEVHLLDLLYRRRGKFTARGLIVDLMWSSDATQPGDEIVNVHVCRIRKKIHRNAIITEPYVGYRIGDRLAEEIGRLHAQVA